ncbi:MAG: shikimate kinase [Clostridia bacterium]|nr:shikimate kinase [Clostridia bacterium]
MTDKGNIVLIGFMGAGKTTIGQWISQNLNMQYVDTDDYIENAEGMIINDIFADRGEEYFRDLETKALEDLCGKLDGAVVSAGGGMPVREKNRQLMKQLGTVVYLRAPEDELARRLEGDTKRPMLANTDLRSRIHELMEKREEYYLDAADLIIDTPGKSMEKLYNEIEDYIVK